MRKCPILNTNSLPLGIIGINHKSASLSLRESLAAACKERFCCSHRTPLILLSTCNRTELYFSSDDLPATHRNLLQELRNEVAEEFEHALYSFFGTDSFHHLAKVTAGLDSAVVGETEIQGQVKTAYENYRPAVTKELHFTFQKSLKIGKEIRTNYLIEKGMPSLEGAIHKFGSMVVGDLRDKAILFIGASKINRKVLRYLKLKGASSITICNRTDPTAQQWAEEEGVVMLPWMQAGEWQHFDMVVVGTKSPHHLLIQQQPLLRKKRLLVDLSLPRNIDPMLGRLPETLLVNIDQIQHTVEGDLSENRSMLRRVELRIRKSVHRQVAIFYQREASRELFAV